MSLTKASLLTCTQSSTDLEQCLRQFKQQQNNIMHPALNKTTILRYLYMGKKKCLLNRIYL